MNAVTQASGGDGWSKWQVKRRGDVVTILVTSNTEQTMQPTPAGWGPKILHEETITDSVGRKAIDRAISLSSEYAHRMSS